MDTDNKEMDNVELKYLKNMNDELKSDQLNQEVHSGITKQSKSKQRIIQIDNDKRFNRICGEFKKKANQQQKPMIDEFIKNQSKFNVINDEMANNTTPDLKLSAMMKSITEKLNRLDESQINVVSQIMEEQQQQVMQNCNKWDETLCDEFNLNIIEDTDCKESEDNDVFKLDEIEERSNEENDELDILILEEKRINKLLWQKVESNILDNHSINNIHDVMVGPQTRSQTKELQSKLTHRVDILHPKEFHVDERSHIRDQLIHKLLGYRNKIDFFEKTTFKQYQHSDTSLETLIYLLKNNIKTTNEIADKAIATKILRMTENVDERELLIKWDQGCLRLTKDDIMQAKVFVNKTKSMKWVDVVPLSLRGKIIDYMHHNLNAQHLGKQMTLDNIEDYYWWPQLKQHVKAFVEECELCQHTKYGKSYTASMRIRDLPKAREHVMADFLGPIFGTYYLLVIVDYFTGYTMIIPTIGCGTQQVFDALVKHWIPIFGLFKVFETDYGSGFDNNIMYHIFKEFKVTQNFAEARNHRGIGKVERQIGFVQSLLNRYNIEADNSLVYHKTNNPSKKLIWERVKVLAPFIQQTINRKRPRFTQYSPNMLMFGTELNDYANIKELIQALDDNQHKFKTKEQKEDYLYVRDLIDDIEVIRTAYTKDWQKYTWISKQAYEKRNQLTKLTQDKIDKELKLGTKILYYIGDKHEAQQKWRQKWTGPWLINSEVIDHSTVQIADPENGNSKWVSVDRLKLFKQGKREVMKLKTYEKGLQSENSQSDNKPAAQLAMQLAQW